MKNNEYKQCEKDIAKKGKGRYALFKLFAMYSYLFLAFAAVGSAGIFFKDWTLVEHGTPPAAILLYATCFQVLFALLFGHYYFLACYSKDDYLDMAMQEERNLERYTK